MKFRFHFSLLVVLLFSLQSCREKEVYLVPEINIIKPEENASFNLPGKILLELSVKSSQTLKYIRISVDDQNQVPLFGSKYIYPDSNNISATVELNLEILSGDSSGPYFVHVVTDDGTKLNHAFRQIELVNASLKFKGFYLFSRPSVNRLQINYFDENYNESSFINLDGEFVDAETSVHNDLLFLAATIPGKLYAMSFENQNLKWEQHPESPYPEYADLYEDGNYLYVAYENGRIAALSEQSGLQKTGTKTLLDSIPEKIGVSGNYFLGDFKQRTGPKRAWVSFYRATGATFQKFQTDTKVLAFYPSSEDDAIDFIGNQNGKGNIGRFYFEDNRKTVLTVIDEGEVSQCCKPDDTRYLISVGKTVYNVLFESGIYSVFMESSSTISGIEYDSVKAQVIVVTSNRIEVYNYPDAQLIKTITSSGDIKAVRLRFGY